MELEHIWIAIFTYKWQTYMEWPTARSYVGSLRKLFTGVFGNVHPRRIQRNRSVRASLPLVMEAVKGATGNFLKINVKPRVGVIASHSGMNEQWGIFDEEYRVVAVESQSLTIQGVRSGQVLTIVAESPGIPLTAADYPPGQLISLSDPWRRPLN